MTGFFAEVIGELFTGKVLSYTKRLQNAVNGAQRATYGHPLDTDLISMLLVAGRCQPAVIGDAAAAASDRCSHCWTGEWHHPIGRDPRCESGAPVGLSLWHTSIIHWQVLILTGGLQLRDGPEPRLTHLR
jgi:hypothetical protein